jgi:hypothetical protein
MARADSFKQSAGEWRTLAWRGIATVDSLQRQRRIELAHADSVGTDTLATHLGLNVIRPGQFYLADSTDIVRLWRDHVWAQRAQMIEGLLREAAKDFERGLAAYDSAYTLASAQRDTALARVDTLEATIAEGIEVIGCSINLGLLSIGCPSRTVSAVFGVLLGVGLTVGLSR